MVVIDGSTIVGLADDGSVLDLIVFDGPSPTIEVFTVEHGFEAVFGQHLFHFIVRDFTDENVAPTNLTAVRLELDHPARKQRPRPIPVVFHEHARDDFPIVEPHPGARSDLEYLDLVPLPEVFVRRPERIATQRAGRVVEEPA